MIAFISGVFLVSICTIFLASFTVLVILVRCTVNCTRDFTQMYRELYGLSYPGIMWPLPSEARVRSQGTRMAYSNMDGESVEGMKSN